MSDGTRTLNRPDYPPIDWMTGTPDDYNPGDTLRIWTTGPNEGRACGLIMPPRGASKFMNKGPHYGMPVPDSRHFPDGMQHFNRGPIEVESNGNIVTVQGGKLPIRGSHTKGRGKRLPDGIAWLHREGPHADQAGDIGLYGVAHAVDVPAGAVLFCGVVKFGMTQAEAEEINSTMYSAELWPDPQYGGQKVFAGAAPVEFSAWPNYRDRIAAEADDMPEEMEVVCWEDPATGETVCSGGCSVSERPIAVASSQAPEWIDLGTEAGQKALRHHPDASIPSIPWTSSDNDELFINTTPTNIRFTAPVMAEVDETAFNELRADVNDITQELRTLADLVAKQIIGEAMEDFGDMNRVEALEARLRELETQMNERETPQPEGTAEANDALNSTAGIPQSR